jgi:hypothetical protein
MAAIAKPLRELHRDHLGVFSDTPRCSFGERSAQSEWRH